MKIQKKILLFASLCATLLTIQVAQAEEVTDTKSAGTETVYYRGEELELPIQEEGLEVVTPIITEETQHTLGSEAKVLMPQSRALITAGEGDRPGYDFIDVSSHNGTLSVADYQNMKKYGVKGVCVKLTEGTSYVNPYAKSQIDNALDAGLSVSAYHYSHFTTKEQAEAEADFFASKASEFGLGTDTVMVNDAENSIMNNGFATENSLHFALRLINKLGYKTVIHYSYANWFNTGVLNVDTLKPDSLWVANYVSNPSGANLFHTGNAAWQWSSEVVFPEIPNKRFDVSMDYSGYFDRDANSGFNNVYRAYNANSGAHLYTISRNEFNKLTKLGWYSEGIAWKAAQQGVPVYRLYNPNTGEHFYTKNKVEYDLVGKKGWRQEGVAFYSDSEFGVPVFRLFNPNAKGAGSHHYTLNTHERDVLVKAGWKYELVAFYGVK